MNIVRKESKYTSPINPMMINDAGIGANRLVISNNYLNNYNYFNKNNIKMLEFRKKKYLENKFKSEESKREKSLPELVYMASYFVSFNKIKNDSIKKDKNNNSFKKTEIKFLDDLIENKNEFKYYPRKNRIRKTHKVYDDLIRELNTQKNRKEINYDNIKKEVLNQNNLNCQNKKNNITQNNELYSESFDYKFKNKENNTICKVIFGKALSNDYRYKINLNKKRKINYFIKPKNIDIKNSHINLKKNYPDSKYTKYIVTNINSNRGKANRDLISII